MTTEPSAHDEMLSSYLDDEATPDEIARVESDADLRARLDALRLAKELVAEPVAPLDVDDADRMVAAALTARPAGRPVADLSTERERRRPRVLPGAAAAAAFVLLALGGGFLATRDTDDSTEVADAATDEATDDGAGADGTAETDSMFTPQAAAPADTAEGEVAREGDEASDEMAESPDSDAGSAVLEDRLDAHSRRGGILGGVTSVDDSAALEALVRDRLETAPLDPDDETVPSTTSTADQSTANCGVELSGFAVDTPAPIIERATIAIDGVPTVVALVESPPGTLLILGTQPGICSPITQLGAITP